MDEVKVGFRPLLTRAPLLDVILACPSEYDCAPLYLVEEYEGNKELVNKELRKASLQRVGDGKNSLKSDVQIAMELVAPVGMGIVRVYGLGLAMAKYLVVANPVVAVMTAPALFLSGKKLITDLKRALVTDGKVRNLIQKAQKYTDLQQYKEAECCIKEALEEDINPDYKRNGDLYLQLGMIQLQDQRPRQAMVAFARASVLFYEKDEFVLGEEQYKISKRGFAELLAISALDSFARDEKALDEWEGLMEDFVQSCQKRLNTIVKKKEKGALLGLFGTDQKSAEYGRELSAKASFLLAKMKIRNASKDEIEDVDDYIQIGLETLRKSALSTQEYFDAVLEQAQFYCSAAMGQQFSEDKARIALSLMREAANTIVDEDPVLAARVQSEAVRFGLEILPNISTNHQIISETIEPLLGDFEKCLTKKEVSEMAYADVCQAWLQEQKYKLSSDKQVRRLAIENSVEIYLQANEPVSAMYSGLRLAYLSDNKKGFNEALHLVQKAAQETITTERHPVSVAFAGKYLLDSMNILEESSDEFTREKTAQGFLNAASYVRENKVSIPFYLNGKAVVHPWRVSEQILQGLAAVEFARSQNFAQAIRLYETVRTRSQFSKRVELMYSIEYALLQMQLGDLEQAKQLLLELEREARGNNLPMVQRRALEICHALDNPESELFKQLGGYKKKEEQGSIALELKEDDGFLGRYNQLKDLTLESSKEFLSKIQELELEKHFIGKNHNQIELVQEQMKRLESGEFRIAIVGEFSAGKSTFLNALLGQQVLPVSIRPTTSVINRLFWGEEFLLKVLYQNGNIEEHDLSSIKNFVTERKNPNNKKQVKEVWIYAPLELLKGGVSLIDTPGISSLFKGHTELTYSLIPQCDAVILLATGRQPYTASIEEFLHDLKSVVDNKVFYILNKIDQIEKENVDTAVKFAGERVAEEVMGAQVFPISAYSALAVRRVENKDADLEDYEDDPRLPEEIPFDKLLDDSGVPQLERELGSFLEETKGIPLLKELTNRLLNIVKSSEQLLITEEQLLKMDVRKLQASYKKLIGKKELERVRFGEQITSLKKDLDKKLDICIQKTIQNLNTLPHDVLGRLNLNTYDVENEEKMEQLKQRLQNLIKSEMQRILQTGEKEVVIETQKYVIEAHSELKKTISNLSKDFETTLQVDIDPNFVGLNVDSSSITSDISLGGNWGGTILQGAFGFLAGFFLGLGPIGIAVAFLGNLGIASYISEKRLQEVRNIIETKLTQMAKEIKVEIEDSLREGIADTVASIQKELDTKNEGVFQFFETQLDEIYSHFEANEQELQERRERLQGFTSYGRRIKRVFEKYQLL